MPQFANVQAHYDLFDGFFHLFLEPTQAYSYVYFEHEDMALEEVQFAKIDLTLDDLGLQPGMRLLNAGCGRGSVMKRAIERYGVNVIGLTLTKNQAAHVQKSFDQMDSPLNKRALLDGWEQFREPVDRIVSVGAFEHFGHNRYDDFFETACNILPDDSVMSLHTIAGPTKQQMTDNGRPLSLNVIRFFWCIFTEIFPGGRIPAIEDGRRDRTRSWLQAYPAPVATSVLHPDPRLAGQSAREKPKVRPSRFNPKMSTTQYMKYFTDYATLFRAGYTDVNQFTPQK